MPLGEYVTFFADSDYLRAAKKTKQISIFLKSNPVTLLCEVANVCRL